MRTQIRVVPVTAPRGSFPLRHLESYVQDCLRLYADRPDMTDAEKSTLELDRRTLRTRIVGDTLVTTITKTLTHAEELADDLQRATAGLLSLRSLYDENGQLKTDENGQVPGDVLKKLREVIWADYVRPQTGSGVEGTQATAAPPAEPNGPVAPPPPQTYDQRRLIWETGLAMGGWTIPDQIDVAIKYVRQMVLPDLTDEEAYRWESIPR